MRTRDFVLKWGLIPGCISIIVHILIYQCGISEKTFLKNARLSIFYIDTMEMKGFFS